MTYTTNNPQIERCPECSGRLVPRGMYPATSTDPTPTHERFVCIDCEMQIKSFGGAL